MQEQLNQAYSEFKNEALAISRELMKQLSAPILINLPAAWSKNRKRILIVGQETMGWNYNAEEHPENSFPNIHTFEDFISAPESIPAMLETYRHFEFAKTRPKNHRSPYWRAYRQIRKAVGDKPDGFETRVIATNLFRMSYNGESIVGKNIPMSDYEKIIELSGNLLKKELKILRPTSVIFFTGPRCNNALYKIFEDCETKQWKDYDQSRTSEIIHPLLPKNTFRTYHPGYLNWGHWHIVNEIIEGLE